MFTRLACLELSLIPVKERERVCGKVSNQRFVLAGANNRNVIITYRFLAAPVQANRDFFYIECMTVYFNFKYFP